MLAQLKPVFTSPQSLRDLAGLPVLGVVSRVVVGQAARAQWRTSLILFTGAIASLIVVFGLVVLVEVRGPGFRALLLGA